MGDLKSEYRKYLERRRIYFRKSNLELYPTNDRLTKLIKVLSIFHLYLNNHELYRPNLASLRFKELI